MKHKWRDIADDISENKQREITIEDVAAFVEKRARSASHPIFGDILPPKQYQGKAQKSANSPLRAPGRAAAFGISGDSKNYQTSRNLPQCPLCKNNHWLSRCNELRSKSDKKVNVKSPEKEEVTRCNENNEVSGQSGYIKIRENQNTQKAVTSLAIVSVKVKVPGHATVVETYAFLDSGSNTTFCTKELMDQLHATGRETTLSLTTLGIKSNQTKTSVLSLQVSDLDENNIIDLPLVFSTLRLPVTTENRANNLDLCNFPHLQEINLADIDADIGLLIGSNVPRALEPREVKSGKPGEPYATRTDLGWVINGPLMRSGDSHHTANLIKTDVDLSMQFKKYCELDFNDSSYNSKAVMSQEDKRALDNMKSSIQLKDGHYEISLPWKVGCPDLPNNRSMAEYRLQHLKGRLQRDPALLDKYKAFIDNLLEKGYAREVPPDKND
eukprot:gene13533-14941_t